MRIVGNTLTTLPESNAQVLSVLFGVAEDNRRFVRTATTSEASNRKGCVDE